MYIVLKLSQFIYICQKSAKSLEIKVREKRMSSRLTQEELANLSGRHRAYHAGIAGGKRNISLKNLEKIANALKVKPDKLLRK